MSTTQLAFNECLNVSEAWKPLQSKFIPIWRISLSWKRTVPNCRRWASKTNGSATRLCANAHPLMLQLLSTWPSKISKRRREPGRSFVISVTSMTSILPLPPPRPRLQNQNQNPTKPKFPSPRCPRNTLRSLRKQSGRPTRRP